MMQTQLKTVPIVSTFPAVVDVATGGDQQQQEKQYRGPRCGFCHGKMEVSYTGAWSESEGELLRYRKCVSCGLTESFTERRRKN